MTTVRAIQQGDRAAWRQLFLDYGVFYETAFDDAVLDGVWGWLMDDAAEVTAFVALAPTGSATEGEVVGFAHYRRVSDTFTAGSGWFLDDLYVDPGHRGAGHARALIEAIAGHAASHGGGTLRWITAADNVRAQGLYDTLAQRQTWVTYELET